MKKRSELLCVSEARLKQESEMSRLQVSDILVLTEEEETSPLFVSPRTVRRVEVSKLQARKEVGFVGLKFNFGEENQLLVTVV